MLAHEVSELERLGHEFQVLASGLLRSGRPGWEAWFDAGLELKRAAQRLRVIAPHAPALRPVAFPKKPATKEPAAPRPVLRPYTRKL